MKHFALVFVRKPQRDVTSNVKSDPVPRNVNSKFIPTSGRTAPSPLFPTR